MMCCLDALGVPRRRIPVDATVFVSYILPPFLCYLAVAVLVLIPQTRTARIALWPIFALLALRAAASVTISNGKPEFLILDGYFYRAMFNLSARTLWWAMIKEPLVRRIRPAHSSPSIAMDAFDLVTNIRGYGWNWSHGFSFPRDTRPKNRFAFALHTFLSAIAHLFLFGICHRSILSFRSPDPTTNGLGLFSETFPSFTPYFRTCLIMALDYILHYSSLQGGYDIATLTGVLVFKQEPTQWPPMFDFPWPWRTTSLTEFWGHKWHQWFRNISLSLSGY